MGIQNKLRNMVVDTSMTPLNNALLAGLQTRFRAVCADHVASMLIPKFKMNLPESERHTMKLLLAHAVSALDNQTTTTTSNNDHLAPRPAPDTDDDDLFDL